MFIQNLYNFIKILLNIYLNTANGGTGISKDSDEEQKVVTILRIFHQTPAASAKFINQLCQFILQTEKAVLIEASSPFRGTLMKFLLRYPSETLEIFLNDKYIKVR